MEAGFDPHQDVTRCQTLLGRWKIQWNVNTARYLTLKHQYSQFSLFQPLEHVSTTLSY